jgi:hypothetical protein
MITSRSHTNSVLDKFYSVEVLRATLADPPNAPELQNNRRFAVLGKTRDKIDPPNASDLQFFLQVPHVFPLDLHIPSFFDGTECELHPCEAVVPRKFQLQLSPNRHGSRRNPTKIHRSSQNPTEIERENEEARTPW